MLTFFAGLWPMLWHFVGGSSAILACLAVAWFVPAFRQLALTAALAIGVALGAYTIGVSDERARSNAQLDAILKATAEQIDEAQTAAEAARVAAEKSVPRIIDVPEPTRCVPNDKQKRRKSRDNHDRAC